MNFIAVNGFELPVNDNKIGYITRDSDICVKFIDNYNLYSDMIPNNYIKQLGRELITITNILHFIEDKRKKMLKMNNDDYINDYSIYFNTPKMCLIRLEQLFILNDLIRKITTR